MSGIAGILSFDREAPIASELRRLASGIEVLGPDARNVVCRNPIGMAHSGFYTTPEATGEIQPIQIGPLLIAIDGRLDNREEIHAVSACSLPLRETTDVQIVGAAYLRFGVEALAQLEGDWALAVWDSAAKSLVLARDCMGVRRLFYRLEAGRIRWCSIVAPLISKQDESVSLDPSYLVNCFLSRPAADTTAFREIRSILPAHYLHVDHQGKARACRYWSLTAGDRSEIRTDDEYDEAFRLTLAQAVKRRMRSTSSVLAELSGGIDSSTIVCVADGISKRYHIPEVKTVSYFDPEEPSGDEREYFRAVEEQRGQQGVHISFSEMRAMYADDDLAPLPSDCAVSNPGYFRKTLVWADMLDSVRRHSNTRVVLSGLGGDELLGGVQDEVPELADLLVQAHLRAFGRTSLAWSMKRKKPMVWLWRDATSFSMARYRPSRLLQPSPKIKPAWLLLDCPKRNRGFEGFAPWSSLRPSLAALEMDRYHLGCQLTCTDPPLRGMAEWRYPFLDRTLYRLIARMPRTQIVSSDVRRRLMRRALHGVVPAPVLTRKSKWFGSRALSRSLSTPSVDRFLRENWITDGVIVDLASVRKHLDRARHGDGEGARALITAIGLEQWLRTQPVSVRF